MAAMAACVVVDNHKVYIFQEEETEESSEREAVKESMLALKPVDPKAIYEKVDIHIHA